MTASINEQLVTDQNCASPFGQKRIFAEVLMQLGLKKDDVFLPLVRYGPLCTVAPDAQIRDMDACP